MLFSQFIQQWGEGDALLMLWLVLLVVTGLVCGIGTGFFRARKIQPNGFKWKILRHEAMFATLTVLVSGVVLGQVTAVLRRHGILAFNDQPAPWWVIALEYALYFIGFDTWFYWLHRAMHKEPFYSWVHKVHHRSTAPNLLTTLSVSPLESLINGGFVPLFLAAFTVHPATMALIGPTNILMGLYVHTGYEFLPRWWNRTWLTKWFITTTVHDQHHRYFPCNYGGYTMLLTHEAVRK